MERKTFLALVGFAVAFGLVLELLKGAAPGHARIQEMADPYEDMVDDEITDLQRARAGRIEGVATTDQQNETNNQRLGGLTASAGQTPASTGAQPNATAATEAAVPADGKKTDKAKAKDKKKDDKKKKKKKKKTDGEKKDENEKPEEKDNKKGDDDAAAGGRPPVQTAGALAAAPPSGPSDIPQSQREWELLLLNEPDFKATEKFIQYYNSGLVKDEVFFAVVHQMLEDSRPKMRQLGVIALGSSNPSARNFAELAFAVQNEHGVTPVKTQAQGYMKNYTQLGHLRYLGQAMLLKESPFVNLEAMRLVRVAAEQHLKPLKAARTPDEESGETDLSSEDANAPAATQAESETQTQTAEPKKKQVDVTSYFKPFVLALTRLQQSYTDPELRAAATQTLNSLTTLMPQIATNEAGHE